MNKGDLINKVAEDANLTKTQATEAINTVLTTITESLCDGERVSLIGFGTFSINRRNARTCLNPQTKKTMKVPAKNVIKFKAGKGLNENVN